MSKIFRLSYEHTNHSGQSDAYKDWDGGNGFPYYEDIRKKIKTSDGEKSKLEITSIPSPFARIDIAKNAFDEVNQLSMEGDTTFHKTVSDVLDVGEIFFNYDKLKDKIEIITWHPANVQNMLKSPNIGNRFLGETLKTYLESDKGTYNFDEHQNYYILNYKKGNNMLDIIGATSPATLFFSSANNLTYLSENITFANNDHPFDKDLVPLYKRDYEYIKAWFIMRASIPDFSTKMPEVNNYLKKTLSCISDENKRDELRNISEADSNKYKHLVVGQAEEVEMFGCPLLMLDIKPVTESDFTIRPTRDDVAYKPLVLPVESGNTYKDFQYAQGLWGTTAHANFVDPLPLNQRHLPADGRVQPYLTISDFLEDTIILVPHLLNEKDYVNVMDFKGIDKDCKENISYLLPLKEKFFEYFTPEDLKAPGANGSVAITLESISGNTVLLTLQIPVEGHGRVHTVTYTRKYSGDVNIERNVGGIETFKFDALVMPLVKDHDEDRAFYTIGCVTNNTRNYDFKFFKGKSELNAEKVSEDCRHQNSTQALKAKIYSVSGSNFDYIQVSNIDGIKGLIVPRFRQNLATYAFNVSIDIGTSNTHIEYEKAGTNFEQAFNCEDNESILSPVFIPSTAEIGGSIHEIGLSDEDQLIMRDFLPKEIGKKSRYKYPTRTVLSCAKTYRPNQECTPFSLFNASLTYDKIDKFDYNEDLCNIKWEGSGTLLKRYIECTMLMIRNKIIANNGDLSRTQITWFFPTSMPMRRKANLRDAWNNAYDKYISNGITQSMSESSAPIHYLIDTTDNASDIVSIDIGGGTTDIAFARDRNILSVTSFRFASNSLFENQLAPSNHKNGIVDYFKNIIFKTIEDHELEEEMSPLFNEETHRETANMASFLFSLKDNFILKDVNKDDIDFNVILNSDEHFKIVFIIFYTAILYHVGQIIKSQNYELTRHISFSGNGSKILNVITTNTEDLAEFTKMILEKVTGRKYQSMLTLVGLSRDDNPKTSTSKGGLKANVNNLIPDPVITLRADGHGRISEDFTYEKLLKDEVARKNIITSVEEFFKIILNDIPFKYYNDHFGVTRDSIQIAQSLMKQDLERYLHTAMNILVEENDGNENTELEETMFFYPVKGVINAISQKINENLNNRNDA